MQYIKINLEKYSSKWLQQIFEVSAPTVWRWKKEQRVPYHRMKVLIEALF